MKGFTNAAFSDPSIANKLDKINVDASITKVYSVAGNTQSSILVSSVPNANSIPLYNASGNLSVNKPTENSQTVRKIDLDNKIISFTLSIDKTAWLLDSVSGTYNATITNENLHKDGYDYIFTPSPDSFITYSKSKVFAKDITIENKVSFNASLKIEETLIVYCIGIKNEI